MSKLFYLVPDYIKPSWGVGIICHHVSILVKAGYDAQLLTISKMFHSDWVDIKVPSSSLKNITPLEEDIIVVPEFMAGDNEVKNLKAYKILFVQNISLLYYNFSPGKTHKSQGFTDAIFIMSHMDSVLKKYTDLNMNLIPPFIADYFFKPFHKIHKREKIILMFPKQQQFEYSLIRQIISKTVRKSDHILNRLINDNWKIVELTGYNHHEIAELMSRAAFLITTNTFEAFNTAVPEAMASGCINVCYEAVGPADYLVDGENAFVFQNNQAIALAEKVVELIENYDQFEEELMKMRLNAYKTASEYSKENMQTQLLDYFSSFK